MPLPQFCPQCGAWQSDSASEPKAAGVCVQCQAAIPAGISLRDVVAGLTQRLAATEKRLDQLQGAPAPQAAAEGDFLERLAQRKAASVTPPARSRPLHEIPVAIPVDDQLPPRPARAPVQKDTGLKRLDFDTRTPSAPVASPLPKPRKAGLEQTIGLKWAGWVGAIVLVVGIGLGIKFAYDQRWFDFLSDEMRLVVMSLAGFGLIGAGEYVYRRINRISASALFGSGVAVLFLVSYAGNVYYQLYSYEVAFIFVAVTTMIGAAIAMRGRLVSIAILAHIGGNLAPYILSTGQEPGVPFYSYLYMLQVVALVLALWGHAPQWWALRVLALVTTTFWVLMSLLEGAGKDGGPGQRGLADELLWYGLLYAFTFQGELLRSCLRIAHTVEDAVLRPSARAELSGGAVFSTFVTAGVTALVLYITDGQTPALRGGFVLALAALALAGSFLLMTRLGVSVKSLATGYLVQGIALVLLSVPVLLDGMWISVAWMILSLSFAVLGARLGRTDARVAGLVTWFLALLAWLIEVFTSRPEVGMRAEWLYLLDQPILAGTILAWLLATAGQVLAWLLTARLSSEEYLKEREWWPVGVFVSVASTALLALATLFSLPPLGATLVLILWAWLLAGCESVPNRLGFAVHALVVLLAAALKWVFVDSLVARMTPAWQADTYLPLWNPAMGLGVLLAGSIAALGWWRREILAGWLRASLTDRGGIFAFALTMFVALVITFGLSLEIDRAVEQALAAGNDLSWSAAQFKGLCFTMLWTGVVIVIALLARKLDASVLAPWILMLLLAAKFLLVDTLFPRLAANQPAPALVFMNLQVLAAITVLAGLLTLRYLTPVHTLPRENAQSIGFLTGLCCVLLGLWVGTLEIDRAFASDLAAELSDPRLAKLVAISIFWSVYAIAAVALGFKIRAAWLRYFGLALFGVTLVKVGVFDLGQVKYGYRILSSVGLGLLLLGTSVLYGKLSPILLGEKEEAGAEGPRA